jgi:hypothetical protein
MSETQDFEESAPDVQTVEAEKEESVEGEFEGDLELELSKAKVALKMSVRGAKKGGKMMFRGFRWMVVKTVAIVSIMIVAVAAIALKMKSMKD